MARAIALTLGFWAAAGAILFGTAGRCDIPLFWAYLAVIVIPSIVLLVVLCRHSPGLIEERIRPGPGERDHLSKFVLTAGLLADLVLSGLHVGRFHWAGQFPMAVQIAGLAGVAAGFFLVGWAMWANPFFSSAVRIQQDRRQTLVTSGPYRLVRHPGYTGGILFIVGTSLALGSAWSLLPTAAMIAAIIRRTMLEDAMLRRELAGYPDYARTVRYRLVPALW